MKHIYRGRYIALFALLCVAFFNIIPNSLWSAEVDTVWSIDYIGEITFQHPITKNIIVNGGIKLIELDSKDGKLVKEIEFGNKNEKTNNKFHNNYINPFFKIL